MDFRGSHILSIDQFDRSDIEKLFSVADKLEPYASKEKNHACSRRSDTG